MSWKGSFTLKHDSFRVNSGDLLFVLHFASNSRLKICLNFCLVTAMDPSNTLRYLWDIVSNTNTRVREIRVGCTPKTRHSHRNSIDTGFHWYQCLCILLENWFCFDRKKRLAEMKEAAKVSKYGSVMQISGSDFVREVSQAPQDVWVVVFLYKEGYFTFQILLASYTSFSYQNCDKFVWYNIWCFLLLIGSELYKYPFSKHLI